MVLINNWLSGSKNFIVGVTLYEAYGADTGLEQLFAQGETPYTKKRLEEALRGLLETPTETVDTPPISEVSAPVLPVAPPPPPPDNILQALVDGANERYQYMKHLQAQMGFYDGDNGDETRQRCHELSKEIIQVEKEVNALWAKRDYYLQYGRLPDMPEEEEFVIPTDPLELNKCIDTLKRNIRRNKNKAKNKPTAPEYPALVKYYEGLLKQVYDSIKKKD